LSFIRDESAIKKRDDVFKKYDKLVENLKTYVNNTLYNKWKYEVDEMSSEGLQKRMKKPVFARGEEDHNV